jgi:hypothetical protein
MEMRYRKLGDGKSIRPGRKEEKIFRQAQGFTVTS